jgi:chromosomal replication initiation ATPase DnaA
MKTNAKALPDPIITNHVDYDVALAIVAGIAKGHKLSPDQLLFSDRRQSVTWARFLAMFLITEICRYTRVQTGDVLARDQSDITHGIGRIIERAKSDRRFRSQVRQWGAWARDQKARRSAQPAPLKNVIPFSRATKNAVKPSRHPKCHNAS